MQRLLLLKKNEPFLFHFYFKLYTDISLSSESTTRRRFYSYPIIVQSLHVCKFPTKTSCLLLITFCRLVIRWTTHSRMRHSKDKWGALWAFSEQTKEHKCCMHEITVWIKRQKEIGLIFLGFTVGVQITYQCPLSHQSTASSSWSPWSPCRWYHLLHLRTAAHSHEVHWQ